MRTNSSNLKFLGSCPVCSEPYAEKRTAVIDEGKETITLHIDCAKCQSSILLAVNPGLKGLVTTVGIPTDITKNDLAKIKKVSRITSDDVLELHSFLERQSH